MLGLHLTLDFYGCNKENLSNSEFIYQTLNELPDLIGMKKLTKPSLTIYEGNPKGFDKGGISGFVIIAESHISVHTFVEQEFASIDIFSCKEFDVEKATNYLFDKLKAKKVEKNLINRGVEFPKDVKLASVAVNKQRLNILKN